MEAGHVHTAKMADEEDQQVQNAFDILVSITEKSGNLRKDLKQDILQSVEKKKTMYSRTVLTYSETKCTSAVPILVCVCVWGGGCGRLCVCVRVFFI